MNALPKHYPEYLMEAACLGILMIAASIVTIMLEYSGSPIRQAIADPTLRRLVIGVVMGMIVSALIYSPWGKRSGAHLNPAVTLTFFRLGKVKPVDAAFYILAQFVGSWLGILLAVVLLGEVIADPTVNYIVTVPGSWGAIAAFSAELIISFGIMLMILIVSNTAAIARWTGVFVGILIALYITLEAPLSGMSMNPARTLASALSAEVWTAIWIYFTAPLSGMLLASEVYVQMNGHDAVRCAKLHHDSHSRCIFRCGYRHRSRRSHLSDTLPEL